MRKVLLAPALLLILVPALVAPAALAAQSLITVSPQQCVWHAGDDPSWAAPNLDESGWQPYTQWRQPDQPHYWVRCHTDLTKLRNTAHPAIQITLYAAYQLYLDGALIGEAGNLRSGNYSMNSIRSFPAPASHLSTQPATLAVRITYRYADPWVGASDRSLATLQYGSSVTLEAGDLTVLEGRRANEILAQLRNPFISFVSLGVIGVLGLVLLAQFFQDRSRYDLLYLSLTALATAVVNTRLLCIAALWDFPVYANVAFYASGVMVIAITQPFFSFSVAARRVPQVFWILVVISLFRNVLQSLGLFLSPAHSLALEASVTASVWVRSLSYAATLCPPLHPLSPSGPTGAYAAHDAVGCTLLGLGRNHGALLSRRLALKQQHDVGTCSPGAASRDRMASCRRPRIYGYFCLRNDCLDGTALARSAADGARNARNWPVKCNRRARFSRCLIPGELPPTPGTSHPKRLPALARSGRRFLPDLPDPRDGSTLIVIGDVAGKGLQARNARCTDRRHRTHLVQIHARSSQHSGAAERPLQGRGLVTLPGHAH